MEWEILADYAVENNTLYELCVSTVIFVLQFLLHYLRIALSTLICKKLT